MIKTRNRLLMLLLLSIGLFSNPAVQADAEWPLWQAFKQRFIQADGRVIDFQHPPGITTSEGQAYSMFFALVANEPETFAKLLDWAEEHLSGGDLGQQLPAWLWGQNAAGDWGILDHNAASDADLWIAYSLLEAARLWQRPDYAKRAQQLLKLIAEQQVVEIPGLGQTLLPGPQGFHIGEQRWLLNPSYAPLQLICRLAAADPQGPWQSVHETSLRIMTEASQTGFAADWVYFDPDSRWRLPASKAPIGSYDAIRVYLWAGMLHDSDPLKPVLLEHNNGMLFWLKSGRNWPPEVIQMPTAIGEGRGPAGFSAALLPYLTAFQQTELLEQQLQRIQRKSRGDLLGEYQHYYDQMLGLFGLGWHQQKFRFGANGQLLPAWQPDSE